MYIDFYKNNLEKADVKFESGLTKEEIVQVERLYNFTFPPDLKEFLSLALPVSKDWINWRNPESSHIQKAFDWVYDGFYFDIEHNDFWLNGWGEKPIDLQESFLIAKQMIDEAPKLIPIRGHRYIPEFPNERNNPVFSVYQTDIIYYGNNLWNYFENEFSYYFKKSTYQINEPVKQINFWSLFAEELI